MANENFTCTICGGTFEKGWTDDEAQAELHTTFPGADFAQCDIVCDECYNKFIRRTVN